MQVPLHPMLVHFPIVLTFLLPILILIFAFMIKNKKMTPKGWMIIMGLQMAVVASGYLSLETGETEEHQVEKVLSKKLIHEHEEAAEIFVGSSVLCLVLSIGVYFLQNEHTHKLRSLIAVVTLISGYLAYRAGNLGGELVYKHQAAAAYALEETPPVEGLLPTPGMNTSESPMPVNDSENESLKADDNDYGNVDDVPETLDEEKQED